MKDQHVKRSLGQGLGGLSDSGEDSNLTNEHGEHTDIQMRILSELQKMNASLDVVEDKVAMDRKKERQADQRAELGTFSKTSKKDSKNKQVKRYVKHSSDSSDEGSDSPLLSNIGRQRQSRGK